MGRTKLVLVFGIIGLNSVGQSKEKDNFFHHRDDEDNGFFSQDSPQNNLFEIFNKSQPVIFVNNPDMLKVHHPHNFGSEKPTSPSLASETTVASTGE